ncbi:MAG: META domain-containing protein [Halioglobus sp.]
MATSTTEIAACLFKKLFAVVLICLIAGCNNDPDALDEYDHRWKRSLSSIDGVVFFRERIALPRTAELEVQLLDLSDPSNPEMIVSSGSLRPKGGPPFDFSIPVVFANLDLELLKNRSYGLRAIILVDDKLMFANEDFVDPADGTLKHILVHRMPQGGESAANSIKSTLWGLTWLKGAAPSPTGSGNRTLDIRFLSNPERAAGFSGCNRFRGPYSSKDGSLSLGPFAGTKMTCVQGKGDIETLYLKTLNGVTGFKLNDGELSLLTNEEIVATFKPL